MTLLQNKTPQGYVSTGSFVGIFYEAIVLITFMVLILNLYRIYRVSKNKMTLDIILGFSLYTIACFFAWLGKIYLWQHLESALEGPYWLQLIYKFKFSCSFVVLGNYFMLNFFYKIFFKEVSPLKRKLLIIVKIIEVTIIITIHIPVYLQGSNDLAQISDAIAFLIMAIDTMMLLPYGIKAFKSAKNDAFGKKYRNIGFLVLLLFNMCVMFFLDRLTMVMGMIGPFGEPGYTPFYFAAWASAIVSLIFGLYGFVRK